MPRPANQFIPDMPDTAARTRAERHLAAMQQQGGAFVEAVRRTRLPMVVTDATLPGNPITFANGAFVELSGYCLEDLLGQEPHFMSGEGTDPAAMRSYTAAMAAGHDANVEIVQYRRDGSAFRAMLFASPVSDGQGAVTNHFLSYLDITRRWEAEAALRALTEDLEHRVANRTAELEAANGRLMDLVAERELLMIEVNHRAKNSLAVAAALLGLQARRQPDLTVRALFEESQERLNAMARVHDLLSRSESVQSIDLATYLAQLCEALGAMTDPARIRLRAEADVGILLAADVAFPIGIVVTELVTNALKYAFPEARDGTVLVQAQWAAGQVEIQVRDDGVGMGDLREGSLGYGLVRSLVKQIAGEITIERNRGVAVRIIFPNGPPRQGKRVGLTSAH